MKKIFSIISILVLSMSVFAYSERSFYGKIISHEHDTITDSFVVDIKLWFVDTTNIDNITLNLTDYLSAVPLNNNVFQQYLPNDSVIISYVFSLNASSLPFYQQYVEFIVVSDADSYKRTENILAGYVYFTPYNTTEIWNIEDFYSLKRVWHTPTSPAPQRIFIPKYKIPQSDITDWSLYERDSATWDHWWVDNFRELEVAGLPYDILMTPIPFDSISYYDDIDDGIDSLLQNPTRLTTFSGTIRGRVVSTIQKDIIGGSTPLKIGLAG